MKVHFIYYDDWIEMYIDGKMVCEGHSLSEEMVAVRILGQDNVTGAEGEDEESTAPWPLES